MTDNLCIWDLIHMSERNKKRPKRKWICKFNSFLQCRVGPIVDLGSGLGYDMPKLLSYGKHVIACDYSQFALDEIEERYPNVETRLFDMTSVFPFSDAYTDIVVADLSLHYFSIKTTKSIIAEIDRILTSNGILIIRVNSLKELINENAPTKIGKNFYIVNGRKKRYFAKEDIEYFFAKWEIDYCEEDIERGEDGEKYLYTVVVEKRNG